jgi:hypothetical protein
MGQKGYGHTISKTLPIKKYEDNYARTKILEPVKLGVRTCAITAHNVLQTLKQPKGN